MSGHDLPIWMAFGFSFFCGIIAVAVAYGMLTNQTKQMRFEISKIWNWKELHEKEEEAKRYQLAKEFQMFQLDYSESKGFLKAIMERLEKIERLLEKSFGQ